MDTRSRGVLDTPLPQGMTTESVQLFANFRNALGQQLVGDLALHRLRQDGGSGSDGGVGRGGADIGQGLGLGSADLFLGGLGAPSEKIFHLGLGFGCDPLGVGPCVGDDVLGLAFGAGAAGLVLGQQLGGLFLEAARVVELGLDALAATIERLQHGAMDAEIREYAHQDDEGDGDPEFRFGEHQDYPFKDASTAPSIALPSGTTPVSRCTIAAAASAAMPRTLRIAASRVAAMAFSASTSLCVNRSSRVLRSALDAAFSFSRVSALIAWARVRAAANSLS